MRELIPTLALWWSEDQPFALATVVSTFRSAPRPVGAVMGVHFGGEAIGSVSGGCVESAVYERAREVLESGEPVLEQYGVGDEMAFAVGLTCGGELEVFIQRIDRGTFPTFKEFADDVEAGRPVVLATVLDGERSGESTTLHRPLQPDADGHKMVARGRFGLTRSRFDDGLRSAAEAALAQDRTESMLVGDEHGSDYRVFMSAFVAPPRMLVFGAIDFAATLAQMGRFLGYRVTVCDARSVFTTANRFPHAEVVVDWPDRYLAEQVAAGAVDARTVVCVLTHDQRFDVPLLELALPLDLGYIGAMGSRRTHEARLRTLRERGLTPYELGKLHSPIGLDLGGHTAAETAVSIAAEIVAHRQGGSGAPLTKTAGPVHRTFAEAGEPGARGA